MTGYPDYLLVPVDHTESILENLARASALPIHDESKELDLFRKFLPNLLERLLVDVLGGCGLRIIVLEPRNDVDQPLVPGPMETLNECLTGVVEPSALIGCAVHTVIDALPLFLIIKLPAKRRDLIGLQMAERWQNMVQKLVLR